MNEFEERARELGRRFGEPSKDELSKDLDIWACKTFDSPEKPVGGGFYD